MPALLRHKMAWPFAAPVDPVKLNIPDYYKVIKHPMDIKTVRTRLVNNHYHCGAHALEDLKKVFTNCIRYNPEGHDVHVMGVKVQALLHEKLSGLPEIEEEILPKHRQSSIGLPQVSSFGSSTRQSSIKEEPVQKSVSKRPPTGGSNSEVASKRQKNSSGETGSSGANKQESSNNNSQGSKKQLIKSEKREQISLNDKSQAKVKN